MCVLEQKFIQCGHCEKRFNTIGQLQSHQTKTNHEKIYKCAHCEKVYDNPITLKVIMFGLRWVLQATYVTSILCLQGHVVSFQRNDDEDEEVISKKSH